MKILIVGGGGREHALAWKIARSPRVTKLWAAPGNAGIAAEAECVPIAAQDVDGLLAFARKARPDLTVVGPEGPLLAGIVDRFSKEGLPTFGPSARAAMLEGSKIFAKELMKKYKIPTADFEIFDDPGGAIDYLRSRTPPIVVKADGLAGGKGVVVAGTLDEAERAVRRIMVERSLGEAGGRVVIEEYLEGEEASFLAVTDGYAVVPLATSQDHKRLLDGDRGPNTGGMGAYSPAPVVTPAIAKWVHERVMKGILEGLRREGVVYRGVLYAGLMVKDDEVKVLEFNARFGDPETQPLMVRLESDLVPLLEAVVAGDLGSLGFAWEPRPSMCVVMAAQGYPGAPVEGAPIEGLEEAAKVPGVVVFQASTRREGDRVVVSGGRVLGVTALGASFPEARERVYEAVGKIRWEGAQYRRDIGFRALQRLKARGI